MTAVVDIPGQKRGFIAGLTWISLGEIPPRDRIRELARRYGNWVAVRADAGQVGFGEPLPGKVSRPVSLAAAIATERAAPWRGTYRIGPDRWWYLAVGRDGLILPDGDLVGGSGEIREAMDRHAAIESWSGEVEATIDDLASAVAGLNGAAIPVRPAAGGFRLKSPLALIAVAGAVVAGVAAYELVQAHRDAQARMRALAAMKAAKRRVVQPWVAQPPPGEALARCEALWNDRQDLVRNGWILDSWDCSFGSGRARIDTSWRRAGGLALAAPGKTLDGEHSVASEDGAAVTPVPAIALSGPEQARRAMWSAAQRWGVAAAIGKQSTAAPGVDRSPVEIDLPMAPWFYGAGAFHVDGFRVQGVHTQLAKSRWIVDGTLFTKGH
ncbi:putative component of type II secretion apparatus [Burkholderiales bacterium GJ-E10]|nr:putative component of type II secretion apparatus [Burkholderiales bacterium GJ-E10]